MDNSYKFLFQKLFPSASVNELKTYRDTIEPSNYEMYQAVSGAIYSKEYKLFALTDKELNQVGEDTTPQQKEEQGIKFEVLRRKFFHERENIGSS